MKKFLRGLASLSLVSGLVLNVASPLVSAQEAVADPVEVYRNINAANEAESHSADFNFDLAIDLEGQAINFAGTGNYQLDVANDAFQLSFNGETEGLDGFVGQVALEEAEVAEDGEADAEEATSPEVASSSLAFDLIIVDGQSYVNYGEGWTLVEAEDVDYNQSKTSFEESFNNSQSLLADLSDEDWVAIVDAYDITETDEEYILTSKAGYDYSETIQSLNLGDILSEQMAAAIDAAQADATAEEQEIYDALADFDWDTYLADVLGQVNSVESRYNKDSLKPTYGNLELSGNLMDLVSPFLEEAGVALPGGIAVNYDLAIEVTFDNYGQSFDIQAPEVDAVAEVVEETVAVEEVVVSEVDESTDDLSDEEEVEETEQAEETVAEETVEGGEESSEALSDSVVVTEEVTETSAE